MFKPGDKVILSDRFVMDEKDRKVETGIILKDLGTKLLADTECSSYMPTCDYSKAHCFIVSWRGHEVVMKKSEMKHLC